MKTVPIREVRPGDVVFLGGVHRQERVVSVHPAGDRVGLLFVSGRPLNFRDDYLIRVVEVAS